MSERRPTVVGTRVVPPDPTIVSAIGRRHSLETAVADLVDNSIDAGASRVLIRIVLRDDRAVGLLVVDDGRGMDSAKIDDAMAYARTRDYEVNALGHFGLGLKAASLSQADTLRVWSRSASGVAVGRGLDRATLDDPAGATVQTFSDDDAAARFLAADRGMDAPTGTIVEWRDVRGFLQTPDVEEQTAWVQQAVDRLDLHLGLVLHRLLARGTVEVTIDILDEAYPSLPGPGREVAPVDPFGYRGHGQVDEFAFALPDGLATARLHVWPVEPSNPAWLLGGRAPVETQGLYVYRNDRLLQAGGWNGLRTPNRDLNHARIEIDLDEVLAPHSSINPEKDGVVFDAEFTQGWLGGSMPDGRRFADYLDEARGQGREARRRNPRPVTVPEPGSGFVPEVIDAIEDNAELAAGDAVSLRWKHLPEGQVFHVDREDRTVWVNQRYRRELGGTAGLSNDDAQVVKVLLLLLLGEHAASATRGAKEKREEAAWQAMILAAVRAARRHGAGRQEGGTS